MEIQTRLKEFLFVRVVQMLRDKKYDILEPILDRYISRQAKFSIGAGNNIFQKLMLVVIEGINIPENIKEKLKQILY